MPDGNFSTVSERSAEEPLDVTALEISWVRAIARPATDVEIDEVEDGICREEQRVQIACLALAAG
jgi:hypothetical protein